MAFYKLFEPDGFCKPVRTVFAARLKTGFGSLIPLFNADT
jgi:hypothetical protein